jgi:hypothetical protein
LLVSSRHYLDVLLFEKIQDYEEKTLSTSKQEAWQVTLDHINPICFFLFSSHIGMNALILSTKPHTLGIWVHTWLVMLSHAVLRVVQVFHLSDVEFWLVLSVESVGLPSVVM